MDISFKQFFNLEENIKSFIFAIMAIIKSALSGMMFLIPLLMLGVSEDLLLIIIIAIAIISFGLSYWFEKSNQGQLTY